MTKLDAEIGYTKPSRWTRAKKRGLLSPIQTVERRKTTHPGPRTKWPAPRTSRVYCTKHVLQDLCCVFRKTFIDGLRAVAAIKNQGVVSEGCYLLSNVTSFNLNN